MVRAALARHQCGPGSNPGIDAMWVEFVVGSRLCSERFFSWSFGFRLPSKTNISKFQFDQERYNHYVDVLPLNRYLLFTYLLSYLQT